MTLPSTDPDGLEAARRALAAAQAAAAADEPLLGRASEVASDLRNERMVNGWEARVRAAFSTAGTARGAA